MTEEECASYACFLAQPEPREFWMSELGRATFGERWHSFRGPLSINSIQRALHIVNGYYRFLQNSGQLRSYLQMDTRSQKGSWKANPTRTISPAAWQYICESLNGMPETLRNGRLGLSLHLLYGTGMRISELTLAKTNNLRAADGRRARFPEIQPLKWFLQIRNASGTDRQVLLPPIIDGLLRTQLRLRGLSGQLESLLELPIPLIGAPIPQLKTIPAGDPDAYPGISTATVRDQICEFFAHCALQLESVNPEMAGEIANATPGTLRIAHISHALAANVDSLDLSRQVELTSLDRVSEFMKKNVWTCKTSADVFRAAQAFFDQLATRGTKKK